MKLHGAFPELCTLKQHQCWDGKTALACSPRTVLGYEGRGEVLKLFWGMKEEGRGVEGYWGLRKLVQ